MTDTYKKDDESSEACSSLGFIYTRKEDFKKAIEQFETAIRRDPDNLTIQSNLAEAYLKAKQINKAEVEYQKILKITSDHVESLIGLGEVYTALGEDGDGDIYQRAVEYFSLGKKKGESGEGSKKLKRKELAALLYSRGYARVKLYEAPKTKTDEKQLSDAERDFRDCVLNDPDHYKAKRAQEKIKKRLSRFSTQFLTEWIGPWTVTILSLWVFLASQYFFFSGYYTPPRPVTDKAATVKAAEVKPGVVELGKEEFLKVTVQPKTDKIDLSKTGDDKHGAVKSEAVEPMGMGTYALLTFGSLIFMVAGLYLPQILKLKVAGIELEKSSVNQITTSGTLGISK